MTPKKPRRGSQPTETPPDAAAPASSEDSRSRNWRGFLLSRLLGTAVSPITGFFAAIPLAFAGIFLILAWNLGPQRLIDAARLRPFTARAEGRLVESWLALDLDPAAMSNHRLWRPEAMAAQCAVVEFDPGWSDARRGKLRRAFCGVRLQYSTSYYLEEFDTLSKGVPFGWRRDANGFAVPEIRLSSAARQWLATHPEPDPLPMDPPTESALASLRLDHDKPVELAAAGWTRPAIVIPLLFDPRDPQTALPAGRVEEQRDLPPSPMLYLLFAMLAIPGALVWVEGMAFLLGAMPRWAFWFVALVPLVALPWWAERLPRVITGLNAQMGEVLSLLIRDTDRAGLSFAGPPEAAPQAGGDKITWHLDESLYAGTLGGFHFVPPDPPPASRDAARQALIAAVTRQEQALPPAEQTALFERLIAEQQRQLSDAGPVFFEAARQAVVGSAATAETRAAAKRFLAAHGHDFPPYPELTAPPGAPGVQ